MKPVQVHKSKNKLKIKLVHVTPAVACKCLNIYISICDQLWFIDPSYLALILV